MDKSFILKKIYALLFSAFGPQGWWPAQTPFEVMVGAILTQNTNWQNVEKAIANLKKEGLLSPHAMLTLPPRRLATYIRPAGYYNIKAARLKAFLEFFARQYKAEVALMAQEDPLILRGKLLSVSGIGMETADSILLYALNFPLFVVDAYTRRIFSRHALVSSRDTYTEIQNFFMDHLSEDVRLFNEYHALIVRLGKFYCRKTPQCQFCPLKEEEELFNPRCDSCSKDLKRASQRFWLKMEMFADPKVEITAEELKGDAKVQYQRLLKELNNKDAKRLEEEVYVRYKLLLCKRCRDRFNARVKAREFI